MGLTESLFEKPSTTESAAVAADSSTFDEVDFSDFDIYSKEQLLNYIKTAKFKALSLPEDFHLKMQDVELNNKQLMPMCFELYDKMNKLFGNNAFIKIHFTFKY